MSNVFFTSDIHIGHQLVAGKRGFDDPSDHDAWLADIWDSQVGSKDTVYVLGDISINGKQPALDWVAERHGTKHLISGNHDPVHPMFHSKARKLLPAWHEVFETIQPFMRLKLLGQTVWLSHFPYESWGDGEERGGSRFNQYRMQERFGTLLLHGHTHGTEKAHGDMLHVGIDAWRSMVTQETVLQWIVERRGHLMDPGLVRSVSSTNQ